MMIWPRAIQNSGVAKSNIFVPRKALGTAGGVPVPLENRQGR
jgi:hypothetical protein